MTRLSAREIGFLVTLLSVAAARPACAADANNGRILAERWCASCHAIAPNQKSATDVPPPFSAIASKPGFNVDKLAFFLLDPHPKMPNFGLSRSAAADLAAYIAAQRK